MSLSISLRAPALARRLGPVAVFVVFNAGAQPLPAPAVLDPIVVTAARAQRLLTSLPT
jgi:hypothetical protein